MAGADDSRASESGRRLERAREPTAPAIQGNGKINLLIIAAGLGIGGAEVVIQHLARAIDRERFNLLICCVKALGPVGEALRADGYEIVVLSDRPDEKTGVLTFLKLLRLIRARRIDVIHSHTTDAFLDAALCRLLLRRVRHVHTFHFGNYPHRSASHTRFERIGSMFADRLIAVGDVQRGQIMAAYGFKPERIGRVWNGIALQPARDASAFRARIGVADQVLVGVTSTMIEQKGLFEFLEVASRFRDMAARVRFVVVGEGRLRARLDQRRRELGLEQSVIFAGWVPHANEVALPAFDVFFQPSLWEAMSIALLEAMASAKAVVATAVGEAPRIVADGVDGLLVQPRDVDGMEAALRSVIEDPALRRRLGEAAREKVASQFTVERMARAYEEIYLALAQGRPSIR